MRSTAASRPAEPTGRAGSPRGWWSGLGINLALSLLYLLVAPLTEVPHRDWAILVGSYFAAFLLADSMTTNALGVDAGRVSRQLGAGTPLRRILLAKNLTLLLVVGLPTLAATALITLQSEPVERLALTLPAVLGPVLAWLGLGNLSSVLLPVSALPLRQRWRQRRDLRSTARWLAVLALPYALCLVVDPLTELPTLAFRVLGVEPGTNLAVPAMVLLGCGLLTYAGLTAAALVAARRRAFSFHDLPEGAGQRREASPRFVLAA